jgi:hypothetical protein
MSPHLTKSTKTASVRNSILFLMTIFGKHDPTKFAIPIFKSIFDSFQYFK